MFLIRSQGKLLLLLLKPTLRKAVPKGVLKVSCNSFGKLDKAGLVQ